MVLFGICWIALLKFINSRFVIVNNLLNISVYLFFQTEFFSGFDGKIIRGTNIKSCNFIIDPTILPWFFHQREHQPQNRPIHLWRCKQCLIFSRRHTPTYADNSRIHSGYEGEKISAFGCWPRASVFLDRIYPGETKKRDKFHWASRMDRSKIKNFRRLGLSNSLKNSQKN